MKLEREELLMKLGAARAEAPAAWRLIDVRCSCERAPHSSYALRSRNKLRQVRRREGRYLLRQDRYAARSRRAVAVRHRADRDRGRLQDAQGRSRDCSPNSIIGLEQRMEAQYPPSPSWLIACMSPCGQGSSRWPVGSRRGPCSRSSPPSRCSTFTSRLRMAAR